MLKNLKMALFQTFSTWHRILSAFTVLYWPSTIMDQPVSPTSDPVPPSTDQYCLLLNQYHRISTSTAPYWSSTTKYQSIPTYTDPVPSYINQYCLLLTQYHQLSTSTNLYCCWLGITDSCTVYPGSCFFWTLPKLLNPGIDAPSRKPTDLPCPREKLKTAGHAGGKSDIQSKHYQYLNWPTTSFDLPPSGQGQGGSANSGDGLMCT